MPNHVALHREANDLRGQLLHCAELALAEGNEDIAAFYSAMCDAITPALQPFPNAIPREENQTGATPHN